MQRRAKQKAKRRESGKGREEHRAPNTTVRPEPDFPPPLDTIVWLLHDPAAREGLRRQLIDGTAGSIEPLLHKLADSAPCEPEGAPVRWITIEQLMQEAAAEGAEERRRAKEAEGRKAQ